MSAGIDRRSSSELSSVTWAADAMLKQCAAFIISVPKSSYCTTSKTLAGGTIGKHVRHTLDHYRAALEGAPVAGGPGLLIDYDRRERDVPMETDPAEALRAIDSLRSRLSALDDTALDACVRIRVMVSGDGLEAELNSTLARELAFATHHAVHHHAMLGAIAAECGVRVEADFGKAPSTIASERR